MSSTAQFFLLFTFFCLVVQAFFSMLEMAIVSINKVRLQYYVSKGNRRAIWISKLLNHPAQLFGTTLIGVNLAMQLGSEASRQFYMSIGLSPDLAPITQIFLVLVCAELAPMFAGRRYAEHASMLGVGIVYFCSLILLPINWFCDLICKLVYRLFGPPSNLGISLSREEIQKVLEGDTISTKTEKEDIGNVVKNIFTLKNKVAKDLMQPLENVLLIHSKSTLKDMRDLLQEKFVPYVPIYHNSIQNIVAIAYPRDLLRVGDSVRVRDYGRVPWFITENVSILQILKQFRRNNQSVAVVLNESGFAVGILTLDEIIDEIFERVDDWIAFGEGVPEFQQVFVDKTFPGDTKLSDFNKHFHVYLSYENVETLEQLVTVLLGHTPSKGETVRIDQFLLTVEEAPLIGEKMISVRTVY
ncbi:MAG: HlyC/CorC family transporter [Chlamydiae bacterium]|nr:HlyC/CorC family transporter [Chlamydiota bacterium]